MGGALARAQAPAERGVLRVVAAGGVPFVLEDPGGGVGLSVEVWRAVADRSRLDYELSRAASVEEALGLVLARRADVAVGPISITAARASRMHFTQPYLHAGLAILSRPTLRPSQLLAPFLSTSFVAGVGLLFVLLAVVGALIWLAERRGDASDFPRAPRAGIADGAWFALVTMTTVGYGDRVPRTGVGRAITALWMLIAVVSLSSLTAGIASSLTLAGLEAGSIERASSCVERGSRRFAAPPARISRARTAHTCSRPRTWTPPSRCCSGATPRLSFMINPCSNTICVSTPSSGSASRRRRIGAQATALRCARGTS